MSILDSNRQKLVSVIALIDDLCEGDFPHEHSKVCLERIKATFAEALESLNAVDEERTLCRSIGKTLYVIRLFGAIRSLNRCAECF